MQYHLQWSPVFVADQFYHITQIRLKKFQANNMVMATITILVEINQNDISNIGHVDQIYKKISKTNEIFRIFLIIGRIITQIYYPQALYYQIGNLPTFRNILKYFFIENIIRIRYFNKYSTSTRLENEPSKSTR